MNRKIFASVLVLLATFFFLPIVTYPSGEVVQTSSEVSTPSYPDVSDSVKVSGMICAKVTRASGEVLPLSCQHNLVTTNGLSTIRNALYNSTTLDLRNIGFGNSTAPVVGDTALPNEYVSCGFSRSLGGSYTTGNTNVTVYKSITSTCDNILVNTTGLYNSLSGSTLMAGAAIPNAVVLQTGDSLMMNYTISVS